ncbi:MAG: transposase [Anaerolineales bacterium]|nr:transposase [Anaerolineales bacterium]
MDETSDCRGTACRAPTAEGFGKPVKGSLPTIIRSFKSATTRLINKLDWRNGIPVWQRNYFEHIIRSEDSLNCIRRYIQENPIQGSTDPENPYRATLS